MLHVLRRSMMARMIALGVVGLVTSGSQSSCSSDGTLAIREQPEDGADAAFTTLLTLKDSAGTEKYAFQRDELIHFEVMVRNRTHMPAEIRFTGYEGTVQVFEDGGSAAIWDPYHDRVFAQVVETRTFPASSVQVLRFTWNQVLPDGSTLAPGTYEARGRFTPFVDLLPARTPVDDRELESTLRQFTIN